MLFYLFIETIEKKCDVPKIAYLTFNECVGAHFAYEVFRPSIVDWFYPNPFHRLNENYLVVEHAPEVCVNYILKIY